jgi:glycosyltransferase involved in cell wall biosynthesis
MNKASRTLIILTPGFPANETDTICLPFLQNFMLELKMQFPLLHVVILAAEYPFTRASYRWHNTEIHSFNGWKKGRIEKLYIWFLILQQMKEIKGSTNLIGVLSLWCGECAYLGGRFAKKNQIKHFCWIQGQDAKKGNKYVGRMKPLPEELVAISDFIQSEFEKNYGVRPKHVIPVGIRPSEYKIGDPARDIDILGVGSLLPLKQYHLFIEVIHHLKKYFPDIHAVLCGKGEEVNELKKRIQHYDLKENITLTGELPHDEVLQIMGRSRVFLHPSIYEGISVVCNEALYAGCHVISFVRLMNEEIEHWFIVRTLDQMIERAKDILSNPGTNYQAVISFTAADSVKKIIELFD